MNRPGSRPQVCRSSFPWSSADGGLSRVLNEIVGQTASSTRRAAPSSPSAPPLTAWETVDSYEVEFDVPGITRDSVEIELLDGALTISGTWPHQLPEGAEVLRDERPHGLFSRSVKFTTDLEESAVRADLNEGLLRITLPKRPETQPRRIEVGARAVEISGSTEPSPEAQAAKITSETSGGDAPTAE